MKITCIQNEPITEISFLNAGKGPGSFYVDRLPVHVATADSLPADLDAIVATADLQGRERFKQSSNLPPRLLGEVLPWQLRDEILPNLGIRAERTAALLAGDFYTVPGLDKRGGSGDVSNVWRAFSDTFKWVAGVAGNHDTFGEQDAPSSRLASNAYYLDGSSANVDGLSIAGIGGIVGNPRRTHRKTDEQFIEHLERLLASRKDFLLMHDGPNCPERHLRGSSIIRQTINQLCRTLVVRGHAHWAVPMVELEYGTQVLNVDSRVVVMRKE